MNIRYPIYEGVYRILTDKYRLFYRYKARFLNFRPIYSMKRTLLQFTKLVPLHRFKNDADE